MSSAVNDPDASLISLRLLHAAVQFVFDPSFDLPYFLSVPIVSHCL